MISNINIIITYFGSNVNRFWQHFCFLYTCTKNKLFGWLFCVFANKNPKEKYNLQRIYDKQNAGIFCRVQLFTNELLFIIT